MDKQVVMTDVAKTIEPILRAIAFSARAHEGQTRKDGVTPYFSHVVRVGFVLRHVFGVDDVNALTAAALHDCLEDTDTDFDDLEAEFGREVAHWVALLSKDKRLPESEREKAYCSQLQSGPWQVKVCKLADMFDNMVDAGHHSPDKQKKTLKNVKRYLGALEPDLPRQAKKAYEIVVDLYRTLK